MREWTLWEFLMEFYTEDEARQFLTSPQPFLDGMTAAEAMARGGETADAVWSYLEGMDGQIAT